MFEPITIAKLLIFYMILIAVTSLKLDELIHELKKRIKKENLIK